MVTTHSPIPVDGVEFELTLEPIDPLEMVCSDGYDPEGWKFIGSPVVPQTRRFKLVRVGHCYNLNAVCEKLKKYGSIPEGQWREAFKKTFPRNNGQCPIGFADPSWVYPNGSASFPALDVFGGTWDSFFGWVNVGLGEHWRWLVASIPAACLPARQGKADESS